MVRGSASGDDVRRGAAAFRYHATYDVHVQELMHVHEARDPAALVCNHTQEK